MFIPRTSRKKIGELTDFRKSKEYTRYVKNLVNKEFARIKAETIKSFEQHPVTVEINAGPTASNISNTLGGVGNLYTYIGFEKGSKPINPVIQMLQSQIFLSSLIFSKSGTFRAVASYPKPRDIFLITPLPWAQGRSWAEGIERGLSGFGLYLHKESNYSRSGAGLQTTNTIRAGKFQNTHYISKIIKDFELQIKQLNRTSF